MSKKNKAFACLGRSNKGCLGEEFERLGARSGEVKSGTSLFLLNAVK